MFEEMTEGGGGKKKKWLYLAGGTIIIIVFLFFRRTASQAQADAAATSGTTAAATQDPSIVDTGSYPDFSGGTAQDAIGLNQALSTYLAVADQNTSVQMSALNDTLTNMQSHMDTTSASLQQQINSLNLTKTTTAAAINPPTVTPGPIQTTSHPAPATPAGSYVTVTKGMTLSGIASKAYGKQVAYQKGIKDISTANKLSNPNRLSVGQKIFVPAKA
jgi:LysM repeat protein